MCWGNNSYGELDPTTRNSFVATPQSLPIDHGFVAVSDAYDGLCAIDATGGLWCWGNTAKPTAIDGY
jgi:hypothetical protein